MASREHRVQFEPGAIVAERYRIERLLGEGGYGVVYEGEQLSTGQRVAVKMLRPQPDHSLEERSELLARFRREVKVMGSLHHPNTIRLLDSGIADNGARFVVLEYLEGKPLEELLEERGHLSPRLTYRVIMDVLEALGEAHDRGIVHRDIKPGNIMLTGNMKRPGVKVLDFGIAAIQEGFRGENYQQLTMAGKAYGTPAYMAPELLANNEISTRVDIYATGLVMSECLSGERAVTGNTAMEICVNQLHGDVHIPESVRRGPFGNVVLRATAHEPGERYATADEMIADMERVDLSARAQVTPDVDDDDVLDGAPTQAMSAIPGPGATQGSDDAESTQVLPSDAIADELEADDGVRSVEDGVATEAMPALEPRERRIVGSTPAESHTGPTQPMSAVAGPSGAPNRMTAKSPAVGSTDEDTTYAALRTVFVVLVVILFLGSAALAAIYFLL